MRNIALSVILATVMASAPAMAGEVYKCSYSNAATSPSLDYDFSRRADVDKRDVAKLQTALHKAGYKSGPIDGVYGSITTKAVRAYQADRNMPGNGKLTAETLRSLRVTSWCGFDHRLNRNYND